MNRKDKRRKWKERIANFKASGLGVVKWVETQDGITEHQVKYWLKNFKREASKDTSSSSMWLPVTVQKESVEAEKTSGVTIYVHDIKVDIASHFDEAILRDVIKVLKTS